LILRSKHSLHESTGFTHDKGQIWWKFLKTKMKAERNYLLRAKDKNSHQMLTLKAISVRKQNHLK
jgi:hypothetical protein